jgi:AAHS family 4-hydroxybenzoate transporter-like MFS transporter
MTETKTVEIAELLENQEPTWFAAFIFALCCLVMLADGYDNQAINYAAPAIIHEWGISTAAMTPVFNISILGWITGSIAFGMLADRVGRRPATILAVLVFGAFTLAIPLARDLAGLSVLRFCAALGVGGGMPMAIALISDYAKSSRRALFVTLLFLGYTAGSSGGGLLAAEIVPQFGWRSVFYAGGIAGLVIAAILVAGLPESLRYLALWRAGDSRILRYARKLQPHAGFDGSTFFTSGERLQQGVPMKHLFAEGRAAMTSFLFLALGFAFMTHFFLSQWLTTLLTPELGFASAARAQALFQAGGGFAFVFGYLLDKKGVPVTALAMILAAIPVAAIGIATASGPAITMVFTLAAGVLVLGGDVAISALPTMLYPTYMRSTATGATFGVARVGAVLGPMIAGLLIAIATPLGTIFLLGALPVLASGAACFLLDRSITPENAREMTSRPAVARER